MKIAQVVAVYPPRPGGMGQVASDEADELIRRGHEVTFFCLDNLHPWFRLGDGGFAPLLFFRLKNFDLVHLHYPFYGGDIWVMLASIFRKIPYVLTYHMDAAPVGAVKKGAQVLYDRVFARPILRRAKKVLAVSRTHFLSTRGAAWVPPERIIEFPNGIATDIFSPAADPMFPAGTAPAGLPPDWVGRPLLLFVGNLMPIKGLDVLLQGMVKLSNTSLVLGVIGGGYDERRYRQMVKDLKLEGRVSFVGAVADRLALRDYYRSAVAVAVPSRAESFSLVALEALATAVPVIASNVAGLNERVSDGVDGFLFEKDSVEGLVSAVRKMLALSSTERQAMGERGRKKIVENYSLERHIDKLESIYKMVA